jgi:Lon-like ATP-dependent protease
MQRSLRILKVRSFFTNSLQTRPSGFFREDSQNNNKKRKPEKKNLVDFPLEAWQKVVDVLSKSSIEKPSVPKEYPMLLGLPISGRPLFPGFYKSVVIKNQKMIGAVKELLNRKQPYVGAFLLKNEDSDLDIIKSKDDIYEVGVFAQIAHLYLSNNGESMTALLYPHRRIKMTELIIPVEDKKKEEVEQVDSVDYSPVKSTAEKFSIPYLITENLIEIPSKKRSQFVQAITSEIVSVFKDIATDNPLFRDQITTFSVSQSATLFEEPGKLADFAAAMSAGIPSELQEVLESLVIEERLQKSLAVLKKELLNARLQSKIAKDVESKLSKRQEEYYYNEQLKYIKKKLGMESDGKEKLIEKFKSRAVELKMPSNVEIIFKEVIIFLPRN